MPGQLHWQAPSAAEDHVMWSKATNTILWGDCQEWTSNRCEGNDENSSFHKWKQIIKASETCKRPSSTIFVYFFNFQYTSVLPWKLVEETLPNHSGGAKQKTNTTEGRVLICLQIQHMAP